MTYRVTFDIESSEFVATLFNLGASHVEVIRLGFDDEIDEDDTTTTEDDEVMVLNILQGAAQRALMQGEAIKASQLDELIHALQAPPAQRREELINPLKMEQPTGEPPTSKVKPTENSPRAREIKAKVVRDVGCPTCNAPAGQACKSPTSGQTYSVGGHVHAQRIEAWQKS